ncbi:MAG: DivIVA domain-containing protein [Solirubrobacteraceae bacterium]
MSQDLTRSGEGLFGQVRRGYDRDQVDAYITQLQGQVRELQAELALRRADTAVDNALQQVGSEVVDILRQANSTRDSIVEAAERDAAQTRHHAEAHAAAVISAAEQRVRELDEDTDRIWGERERIVEDAHDLARQLAELAELAERRFPQDDAELVDEADVTVVTDEDDDGLKGRDGLADASPSGFGGADASA